MNNKAAAANHKNISVLEKGNPQAAHYVIYRIPDVKLVKGGDKIMTYRLRPKSVNARTYTSCCHTSVVIGVGPKNFIINQESAVVFNHNTITPPIECPDAKGIRVCCEEAVRPDELPKDGITNNKGMPFSFLWQFMGEAIFGSKKNSDQATRELLFMDYTTVTEIAGASAYEAAGFTATSKLLAK